jgi:hypothetical protein
VVINNRQRRNIEEKKAYYCSKKNIFSFKALKHKFIRLQNKIDMRLLFIIFIIRLRISFTGIKKSRDKKN